jgi:uncharacterized protein YhdP
MLVGIMSLLAGIGATADAPRPIRLETRADSGGVELRVIGEANNELAARYTLEVSNGAGNRSRQSGQARLVPGSAVLLLQLRLANSGSPDWEAHLVVHPAEGNPYQVVRTSADIGE